MVALSVRRAVVAGLLACAATVAAQEPTPQEKTLFVSAQETFAPGFAVGNVAIGDPEIADFKVLAGRRELLLLGKAEGTTTLILWDQRRVKRAVINISVVTRESEQTEKELTDLVADYPNVKVRRLKGELVLTGTVTSQADSEALEKIASAAGAQSLVRVSKTDVYNGPPTSEAAPATPPDASGSPATPAAGPAAPRSAPTVEYDLDVLEASLAYSSGSYATGVEPSGRSLFKGKVTAPIGGRATIFIPGAAITADTVGAKDAKKSKSKSASGQPAAPPAPIGIKLTLQPSEIDESGGFTTVVLVETNMPIQGAADPSIMRRARWEIPIAASEPFGLAGAELLAVPAIEQQSGSTLGKAVGVAGMIGGLPGGDRAPGIGYAGSVPTYSRERKTQLLALFHPQIVQGPR